MSILLKNGHIFTAQRKYAENCPSRVDSSQRRHRRTKSIRPPETDQCPSLSIPSVEEFL